MEFNASKPIFEAIKEHYAHLIDIGGLVEGTEMPSVREVALANGINPNTVQRAFSLLIEEGYLVSIPKKGFFVSKRGNSRETLLDESINKLLEEGFYSRRNQFSFTKSEEGERKMIQIKSLTKRFEEVIAVNSLDLTINEGITGLVGHNGAGKSTLFRLIANVYQYDSGEILINGLDSQSDKGKAQVFFLSDNPYVLSNATPNGMLHFYQGFFDIDEEKFKTLIAKFAIPENRKVVNFSKGMKRRLFIALALSSSCPILLLDEAFDGLDPLALEIIKDEIIKISQGNRTIVISSHNISVLERLCDTFVFLNKGKLSKHADACDIGNTFNKYQGLFKQPITKEMFEEMGINVVSFKKIGSLYNIVISGELNEQDIKKKFEATLFEKIPIDSAEIFALEMLDAKKNEEDLINEK